MSIQDKLKDRINNNYDNRNNYSTTVQSRTLNVPEGVGFFKPYYDKINEIAILPYVVETDNDPEVKKGEETYTLTYFRHVNIGPTKDSFVCLNRTFGKACPICEEIDRLKEDYEENKKIIVSLNPKKRSVFNILDRRSENPDQIEIFDTPFYNNPPGSFPKELLEETVDPETKEIICFPDPTANGYWIKFRAAEQTFDKGKYSIYKSFKFVRRKEAIKEEILKKVFQQLLNGQGLRIFTSTTSDIPSARTW